MGLITELFGIVVFFCEHNDCLDCWSHSLRLVKSSNDQNLKIPPFWSSEARRLLQEVWHCTSWPTVATKYSWGRDFILKIFYSANILGTRLYSANILQTPLLALWWYNLNFLTCKWRSDVVFLKCTKNPQAQKRFPLKWENSPD